MTFSYLLPVENLGERPVATADHDKSAGAAEGARDDRPAGSAAPNASNGGVADSGGTRGGAGLAGGPGDERAADNDASGGAAGGGPAGPGAAGAGPVGTGTGADTGAGAGAGAGAGQGAGAPAEPDDYEPYLPPGPNPFSSVHPQCAPPYRPLGGDYPGEGSRGPWPGEPAPASSESGANGHDESHLT